MRKIRKRKICTGSKKAVKKLVIQDPRIQQRDEGACFVLRTLFDVLHKNYLRNTPHQLIPKIFHDLITLQVKKDEKEKARFLCDYLSNLTDSEAIKLFNKFRSPNSGMITDLV